MSVESPPTIKRLDHIQALRGIAALMVVVSHLLIIERKYSADQILGDWASYGMAGVDLFFVISGFIMVYVMWDRPRGPKAAGEFLWGRASRIYPLYWIISAVLLALWFVRPDMVFSSIETPPDIFKSFALFPQDREPLLAVGWTLVHEMYFYLVFTGIMLLPRGAMLPCLGIWMIAIFFGYNLTRSLPSIDPTSKLIFSPLTFEFILGAFAAWIIKVKKYSETSPKKSLGPDLALVMGGALLVSQIFEGTFPSDPFARSLDFALPSALIVFGLAARDIRRISIWKSLVTLGDWSYSLYLTHVLSLTFMGRVWAQFNNDSLLDNVLILAVMVAGTIIISGIVYKYIEAPIIKAARESRGRLFKPQR